MTPAAPTRPLIEVSPEHLTFKLVANSQPGCPLTVRNSSNVTIAFKVKTTEPKRYLVRPNQGLVSALGTEAVNVYLIEKECNELLQTIPMDGTSPDKFLVQTAAVGDAFHAKHNTLSAAQQAEELTSLWTKVDKSSVRNTKLAVRFFLPPPGPPAAMANSPASTPRTPVKRGPYGQSPVSQASPLRAGGCYGSSGDGGRDPARRSTLDDDSRELVSKYDDVSEGDEKELVNYTANLTEERDDLNQSLEEAKKALQREMATRIALESKGNLKQGRQGHGASRTGGGLSSQANPHARGGGGFGWFTLVLVAVVFFLLGHWLDFASASDDARRKSSLGVDGGGRSPGRDGIET